jgi:exoribonuclease-2
MRPVKNSYCDLTARAHQAMVEAGFHPDFPPEIAAEIQADARRAAANGSKDLRSLLWSSIDNDHSRDLDQVEYVERLPEGGYRLLVGIADVDWRVPKNSATDAHARSETTSVYTGVATFPMLPEALATNATSLLDSQDRQSIVIEMQVAASGEVNHENIYPAQIRNKAKLTYNATGAWLESRGAIPQAAAAVPGAEEQLRIQAELSACLSHFRKEQGALSFGSIETTPVIEDGEIKEIRQNGHNVASDIIESFMVAANVSMARFLKSRGCLCIRRVVKTPKRWDRIQAIASQLGTRLPDAPDSRALSDFLAKRKAADPQHFPDLSLSIVKSLGPGEYIVEPPGNEHEGHFGLAVRDYTHSTAPNRRYADLVTQRLLKAALAGNGRNYTESELGEIAAHCTERENAARKVERFMRKALAACLLGSRVGQIFDGIITGAAPKGTYVRIFKLPAEGRVIRGERGLDVGDKVKVRLVSVDVPKGFIDFERVS